jgi:hypothetical protein
MAVLVELNHPMLHRVLETELTLSQTAEPVIYKGQTDQNNHHRKL